MISLVKIPYRLGAVALGVWLGTVPTVRYMCKQIDVMRPVAFATNRNRLTVV
jgi:hypothetical protein